ncbi:hypothetical protein B0H10DRAFT_1775286, partial [Mycena sp. CBHHK59/15]
IVPFQFIKVHYESLSNWTSTADYLRFNPKFHGHPRCDCVLVKTTQKPFFAQLIYLLFPARISCWGFIRFTQKPRKNSEFISVHYIIRGALLVQDFDKTGEFIVVDIVDPDMSLRLESLFPRRREAEHNSR